MGTQNQRSNRRTDLFDTFAAHRNAEYGARLAEGLVRKDGDGDQVIALVDDCERVVYYKNGGVRAQHARADSELYQKILTDAVEPYRDPDLAEKNRLALKQWKAQLRQVVCDEVRKVGLADDVDNLETWVDE